MWGVIKIYSEKGRGVKIFFRKGGSRFFSGEGWVKTSCEEGQDLGISFSIG